METSNMTIIAAISAILYLLFDTVFGWAALSRGKFVADQRLISPSPRPRSRTIYSKDDDVD